MITISHLGLRVRELVDELRAWETSRVAADSPLKQTRFLELTRSEPRSILAWNVAHVASRFLQNERPAGLEVLTKSTASDLVSEMDKNSEHLIVQAIRENFPEDGILGEEGANVASRNGYRWVIDPLDGTVNYLANIPLWGVSIAVERDGDTIFGVIAIPEQGESYLAVRGAGAFRCDSPSPDEKNPLIHAIEIARHRELSSIILATGFGYSARRRKHQGHVISLMIDKIADIRRSGSAVVDLCWLASGRVDAYVEYGLNEWDVAAGALIASEAGAQVGGLLNNNPLTFFVSSHPEIFEDLRSLIIASNGTALFTS